MRGACCPVTQHLSCGCRRLSYLVSESAVWAEPVGTARRAPEAGALLSDKRNESGSKVEPLWHTWAGSTVPDSAVWPNDLLGGVVLAGTSSFLSPPPACAGRACEVATSGGKETGVSGPVAGRPALAGPTACPVCGSGGGQDRPSSLIGPCPEWATVCSKEGAGVGRKLAPSPLALVGEGVFLP